MCTFVRLQRRPDMLHAKLHELVPFTRLEGVEHLAMLAPGSHQQYRIADGVAANAEGLDPNALLTERSMLPSCCLATASRPIFRCGMVKFPSWQRTTARCATTIAGMATLRRARVPTASTCSPSTSSIYLTNWRSEKCISWACRSAARSGGCLPPLIPSGSIRWCCAPPRSRDRRRFGRRVSPRPCHEVWSRWSGRPSNGGSQRRSAPLRRRSLSR